MVQPTLIFNPDISLLTYTESRNSWGTPSTLSVRDLADTSTKSTPLSWSRVSSSKTKELPFQSHKWKEPVAQYHRRSASAKHYSTPYATVTLEQCSIADSLTYSVTDRKYFRKVDYNDGSHKSGNKSQTTSCAHAQNVERVPVSVTTLFDKPKLSDTTDVASCKGSVNDKNTHLAVHQLSTPEKRDQYEWRMRKMLTELKMPENQIVGMLDKDVNPASTNKSKLPFQKDSEIKLVQDDTEKLIETENLSAGKKDCEQNLSSHPALSKLYSKTDYHEVPKFATSIESGKTSSVSTNEQHCVDVRNSNDCNDETNLAVHGRENTTNDHANEGNCRNRFTKQASSDSGHSKDSDTTNTPSNSKSSSSVQDENIRKVSSHGTFPSHSDLSNSSNGDRANVRANLLTIGDNRQYAEVPQVNDLHEGNPSHSTRSRQNDRSPMRNSISSAQSDNTLVAVNSDVMDESSEEIKDPQGISERRDEDRTIHESSSTLSNAETGSLPTPEENSHETEKWRVAHAASDKSVGPTKLCKPQDIPDRRRLSYRDRMKIALSARQRRVDRAFPSCDNKECYTSKRRHSLGSDSLTTIATDDLIAANPLGGNLMHNPSNDIKGNVTVLSQISKTFRSVIFINRSPLLPISKLVEFNFPIVTEQEYLSHLDCISLVGNCGIIIWQHVRVVVSAWICQK